MVSVLQIVVSLIRRTITPADEHEAASDRVAVTCITNQMLHYKFDETSEVKESTEHLRPKNNKLITITKKQPLLLGAT